MEGGRTHLSLSLSPGGLCPGAPLGRCVSKSCLHPRNPRPPAQPGQAPTPGTRCRATGSKSLRSACWPLLGDASQRLSG